MVLEDVARIGPLLVVAGLAVGWIAEAVARAGGSGLLRDLGLGLAGSVLGGLTVWSVIPSGVGMATMCLVGCAGAVVVITGQRGFWRSTGFGV